MDVWLLALMCAWVRVAVLLLLSPAVTHFRAPPVFMVLLSLGLAWALAGQAAPSAALAEGWVWALMNETLWGAALALVLQCAHASVVLVGRVLDVQVGLGMASVLDPATGRPGSVLGQMFSLLAAAVFFGLNGHVMLVQALQYSFQMVPVGTPWAGVPVTALVQVTGGVFTAGVALVAPMLLLLMLVELALAVASRALPQMNVFFVGMPLRLLVGLAAVALLLPTLGGPMQQVYGRAFKTWSGWLQ